MAANLSSTARGVSPPALRLQPCLQGDMQAISQEGDEDMGFDALFEPMINWTQSEIVLERPEGGLDLGQFNSNRHSSASSAEIVLVDSVLPAFGLVAACCDRAHS